MSIQITTSPYVYIGLDIHKEIWTVSIQTDIFIIKLIVLIPIKQEYYVINNFYNHEVFFVYEAGCCKFSIVRYFLNLGRNFLLVNPADVKTGNKERYQKTYALYAKKLCNQLKSGTLKGIILKL